MHPFVQGLNHHLFAEQAASEDKAAERTVVVKAAGRTDRTATVVDRAADRTATVVDSRADRTATFATFET
jgi:hypothetical protein